MAYPLPLQYDDERKERRDYEYMKSLYPDVAKRLLPYIEEECDRMEYDNSMMYDEYPDRLQLHLMCKRVCENVRKHEKFSMEQNMKDFCRRQKKTVSCRWKRQSGCRSRNLNGNLNLCRCRNRIGGNRKEDV